MRSFLAPILLTLALAASPAAAAPACPALLDHRLNTLQGEPENLCRYAGQVVLVVNTASKCAFTPQYEGLEALYEKYRDRGLVVLGFPSNDFGNQEPGTSKQIADFCRLTYSVKFPMFEKSGVTEANANPLHRQLIAATGQAPRWNFHKYLLDRSGKKVQAFGSTVSPDDPQLVAAIEALLAEPAR